MSTAKGLSSSARWLLAGVLAALRSQDAAATTIVPLADAHLVDRAPVVAAVTVESRLGVVGDRPVTEWMAVVDRVLKGRIDAGRIVVALPGGERADGKTLHIFGTPTFYPGLEAILFLRPRPDGSYGLTDFPQGAFLGAKSSQRRLALRDFSEVKVVTMGRVGAREPMREFGRFADWIEDRASGVVRSADYVVEPSRSELSTIVAPFTLFSDAGLNMRWFQFDNGGSVTWRTHTTPLPLLAGGGTNEFKAALAVWNNESTTPIRLVYGGSSSSTAGHKNADGQNVILWTDPNNEISGSFNCFTGGTLAIGGPWYDQNVKGTFGGKTYYRIAEGDIIFNDGVECQDATSPNYSNFVEEVAAHELGHTLGLGHSSEKSNEPNATLREALMYYRAHNDGRHARLNSDDVAGLQSLYRKGGSGGGGGSTPAPSGCPAGTPPGTLCLVKGRFRVTATWQNQFNGTAGNASPIPYTDVSGFMHFGDASNIELLIKILDFGTEFKVFYSQLTNLRFTLTVVDSATGRSKSYSNTPGECGAIDGSTFTAASSALVSSADSLVASAGLCSSDANTLCLQNGRISVTGTWRNQFNSTSGVAQAAKLTNVTGGLFFLDRTNLEILIKAVDFGAYYLVIYGSLSNFEYDLRVTDHVTGTTKTYHNAAGNYCGGLDGSTFTK